MKVQEIAVLLLPYARRDSTITPLGMRAVPNCSATFSGQGSANCQRFVIAGRMLQVVHIKVNKNASGGGGGEIQANLTR